ncbi:MAG: phosphatase PAP2 family protein [Ignavibacteria bacterium]|nr:phosphatase PAP2 family protein [Ignavibacteria bacterium]
MSIKNSLISLIVFLVFISNSYPQSAKDGRNVFDIIGSDIKESVNDGLSVYTAPLKWNKKDGITFAAFVLTTTAVYLKDESIRANSFKQHSVINDKLADAGKLYGNLIAPVIIGGGIYSGGLIMKNEDVRITGRMIFESVLYSGIVTTFFKSLLGRARPYKDKGSQFYQTFSFNTDYTSMPSGHSTVAFALSSVLANRIHNVYASIGLYTIAGITALSRIYHDEHWASDVMLGSAIGYFIGDFISSKKVNSSEGKNRISIYPGPGSLNLNIGL